MTELDRAGRDELHYAAADNNVELVRARLAAGVDPELREWREWLTPLHLAADHGAVDAAVLLLDAGADVNAANRGRGTPLHSAVQAWRSSRDGAMIRLLIERGADHNALTTDGTTPAGVIDGLFRFPDDLAEILLAPWRNLIGTGIPPGLDRTGRDELHYAARRNDTALIRDRLTAGVHPDLPQPGPQLTALHYAAQQGNPDAARTLLHAGADPNARATNGAAPLHIAVSCWSSPPEGAVLRQLIDHGADPTAHTHDGTTVTDLIHRQWRFPDDLARLLR